jgi:hypothetical protein
LVFERFEGISPAATWQDLKLGGEHLRHWKRIALVTDLDWMITIDDGNDNVHRRASPVSSP